MRQVPWPAAGPRRKACQIALSWALAHARGDVEATEALGQSMADDVDTPTDLVVGLGHALILLATVIDAWSDLDLRDLVQNLALLAEVEDL